MITILVITAVLTYLAVWRIVDQHYELQPDPMLITAGIGVAFNIVLE